MPPGIFEMYRFFNLTGIFFVLLSCVSCTKEVFPNDVPAPARVNVVFSPGGLGDQGYNDLILAGFLKLRLAYPDVCFIFYTPESVEEAETIVTDWIAAPAGSTDELFVLASSDYEDMISGILDGQSRYDSPGTGKDILLMESRNRDSLPILTLRISTYGASYLAGLSAAEHYGDRPAVVVGANPYDEPVLSAVYGFMDGWKSVTATGIDTVFMSTDWNGFIMSEEAYRMAGEWAQTYGFVFPVAGGTNNGIYKYLREYPGSMKTAGMDTDQSYLCSDIVGSVLKHIDRLVYDAVGQWIETGDIAEQGYCGLHDGYAEWLWPETIDEETMQTAIGKEDEYENR